MRLRLHCLITIRAVRIEILRLEYSVEFRIERVLEYIRLIPINYMSLQIRGSGGKFRHNKGEILVGNSRVTVDLTICYQPVTVTLYFFTDTNMLHECLQPVRCVPRSRLRIRVNIYI